MFPELFVSPRPCSVDPRAKGIHFFKWNPFPEQQWAWWQEKGSFYWKCIIPKWVSFYAKGTVSISKFRNLRSIVTGYFDFKIFMELVILLLFYHFGNDFWDSLSLEYFHQTMDCSWIIILHECFLQSKVPHRFQLCYCLRGEKFYGNLVSKLLMIITESVFIIASSKLGKNYNFYVANYIWTQISCVLKPFKAIATKTFLLQFAFCLITLSIENKTTNSYLGKV